MLTSIIEWSSAHPVVSACALAALSGILAVFVEVRRLAEFTKPRIRAVLPHGELVHVFDRVWHVTGTAFMMPFVRFPRSMTVVRNGKELTLINPVRLNAAEESRLLDLGTVSHVVNLGGFHGIDLPYYIEKFKPTMWAPAENATALARKGVSVDQYITVGTPFVLQSVL